jgi:hypothetical protein
MSPYRPQATSQNPYVIQDIIAYSPVNKGPPGIGRLSHESLAHS